MPEELRNIIHPQPYLSMAQYAVWAYWYQFCQLLFIPVFSNSLFGKLDFLNIFFWIYDSENCSSVLHESRRCGFVSRQGLAGSGWCLCRLSWRTSALRHELTVSLSHTCAPTNTNSSWSVPETREWSLKTWKLLIQYKCVLKKLVSKIIKHIFNALA